MGQAAPQGLSLRPLRDGDLDQVCLIERTSFGTPWSRELFVEELSRPELCHWLVLAGPSTGSGQAPSTGSGQAPSTGSGQAPSTAPDREQVAAYGGFWKAVDEAHFTNLAVHQDFRGRGLGRRLLLGLLEKARGLGCVRATLEVRPSNAAALGLYQAEGFSVAAMRPHYYTDDGEDALILWKQGL